MNGDRGVRGDEIGPPRTLKKEIKKVQYNQKGLPNSLRFCQKALKFWQKFE
jgi:hypothetical protein